MNDELTLALLARVDRRLMNDELTLALCHAPIDLSVGKSKNFIIKFGFLVRTVDAQRFLHTYYIIVIS